MEPGLVALIAIFATAVALGLWSFARSHASERKLSGAGFVRCDEDAPALARAIADVAGGHPPAPPREYRIGRCFKRPGGLGMVYRFGLVDRTHASRPRQEGEGAAPGGRFDVYLLDLRDPDRAASGAVSVIFAPGKSGLLNRMLAELVKLDPHGEPLELGDSPRNGAFIAAFSDRRAKLDELLSAEAQERLTRAVAAGFFSAHFGAGKLALFASPDRPDVERQLAYVSEWG